MGLIALSNVQQPQSDSKPVVILGSVAAACTALVTALAASGVPPIVLIVIGAVAAVSTAVAGFLTQRKTVPLENVAVQRNDATGDLVSGPAAVVPNGTVVDEPTPAGPSPYSAP